MTRCVSRLSFALYLVCITGLTGCQEDASGRSANVEPDPADSGFIPSLADRGSVQADQFNSEDRLGEFMDACQSNDDCQSGWCITFDDRSVCTRTCLRRGDCPGDWECRLIDNTPPDIVSACMPRGDRLCGVCEQDSDCPNGRCYVLDGDSVCSSDCETDDDCPDAFTCQMRDEHLSCIPVTNSCSCNADFAGDVRICEQSNEFGTCIGRETCDGDLGWTGCSASEPAAEICNQADDDCNGFTDDLPGLGEVCEREGEVDGETIACSGRLICTIDSPDPVCTATEPMPEICNFLDDDCDGTTDEGFEGRGDVCIVGVGACQQFGVNDCSVDGSGFACSVEAGLPVDEICDGLDNDCDGAADETFDGIRTPCSVGSGACLRRGFRLCGDDGQSVVCSAEAAQPAQETCNGVDDDCDSVVDEGYDSLNTACTAGLGICQRVGVQICTADGTGTVCSQSPGEPLIETCNGFDDDCDGSNDEEHPQLGQVCQVGIGTCARSGIYICSDDEQSTQCDAVVIEPGVETCDYQDDDCDGSTDEIFTDANGRYIGVANCGGCGTDCAQLWLPSPEANGVEPICEAAGATAICGFTCLDGFRDADGVASNGCEFQADPTAVYVSTPASGGVDAEDCGAPLRPCSTIARAIEIAAATMRTKVLVSDGLYRETVRLQNGIDVLGGHNRSNWTRNPEINTTIIRANDDAETHSAAVYAIDIVEPTVLDGFAIEGDAPDQGNSYGIYIRHSDQSLQISNNRIRAGNGARGLEGRSGSSGVAGIPGVQGNSAFPQDFRGNGNQCTLGNPAEGDNDGNLGGLGGQQVCGDIDVSGGQGGWTSCPQLNRSEGTGFAGGGGDLGGTGGLGGAGLRSQNQGRCNVSDDASNGRNSTEGATGGAGANGPDGDGGAGAANAAGGLDQLGEHWSGDAGADGIPGTDGGGGGGGGGAGGVAVDWRPNRADIGASGGGGGSGGCGGGGATGGGAGGGSFAIFIVFSDAGPQAADGFPALTNNDLTRGLGGRGGAGGIGGAGGEGGQAGAGGQRGDADLNMAFCIFSGGDGGPGGRGGHGGGGGGGSGGISFDIYVANDNGLTPNYGETNQFILADDDVTAGQGGDGGNSSNVADGLGTAGVVGLSGQIQTSE